MKVAIPKERQPNEARVAATPETVRKMIEKFGVDVVVERGAGLGASFLDKAYEEAGAAIAADEKEAITGADIVLKVRRPLPEEVSLFKRGAILIANLAVYNAREQVEAYANQGIIAFAMEFVPRITRAQAMDVLSSQANLAGYRAVIDASYEFHRAMPMMMTAAGTVAPARVLVMGAGVAGLQAIATAKRLGAIVQATDVRHAVKEQVESLGAKFLEVESAETGETDGGYAREMSEDYQRRQRELITETLKRADIVITTAQIPGKRAPTLITEEMVGVMKPGSIIIDLAVEQGGNCPYSKAGEAVDIDGVRIIAPENMPSRISVDASSLYARNLFNFMSLFIDPDTKELKIDWEDEIIAQTVLTRDGRIVHPVLTDSTYEASADDDRR